MGIALSLGMKEISSINEVLHCIQKIRGERVIVDADLAQLYGVSTKVFNQAVRRNLQRFPQDFMFQLSSEEKAEVVTNCDHLKNIKYYKGLPYAFTEHGAIMAASLLNSPRAVDVSVFVVRAFVKMRQYLSQHQEILKKLSSLEQSVTTHDVHIKSIFHAIRQLMEVPTKSKKQIGF